MKTFSTLEEAQNATIAGGIIHTPRPGVYEVSGSQLRDQGGTKFDGGKPPVSLLPSKPLLAIAEVLGFGAKKYDAHNWRNGIATSRLMSAVFRHLLAYNEGEDLDPESGLPHLAHAGAGIMFMLEQHLRGTGEDDRYKA